MPGQNILGLCNLPVDSALPWQTLTAAVELISAESYNDSSVPIHNSRSCISVWSGSLTRIPYENYDPLIPGYPSTGSEASPLVAGTFWIYQFCCCPGIWFAEFGPTDTGGNQFVTEPTVHCVEFIDQPGDNNTYTEDVPAVIRVGLRVPFQAGTDPATWKKPCRIGPGGVVQPLIADCVDTFDIVDLWSYIPPSHSSHAYGSVSGGYAYSAGCFTDPDIVTGDGWPSQFFGPSSDLYLAGVDPLSTTDHTITGSMFMFGSDGNGTTDVSLTFTITLST